MSITIIPAIDILNGATVRLEQGDYSLATNYQRDPVAVAREFEQQGAKRIHIVDLDAAHGDFRRNFGKIKKIKRAVSSVLEVGGGVRNEDDIERLLDIGVERIIIGTAFARSPDLVYGWVMHYGDIFLVSIDAYDGEVFVDGWEQKTRYADVELARKVSTSKVIGVVYTNIARDGVLQGPDIERTNVIAKMLNVPVILSGGISSEEDIKEVAARADKNVAGIVIGKAIFDNKIVLSDIIEKYDAQKTQFDW